MPSSIYGCINKYVSREKRNAIKAVTISLKCYYFQTNWYYAETRVKASENIFITLRHVKESTNRYYAKNILMKGNYNSTTKYIDRLAEPFN